MSALGDGRSLATLAAYEGFFGLRPAPVLTPEEKVLDLFRQVARDVPAYRSFLAAHGVDPATVDTMEAFRQLPATTKDNYYRRHPLPDLCRHGRLEACDMLALSTGSTGEPAVWPRFITHELESSARFEQILAGAFDVAGQRTLGVICFALGNWVGGLYTLACCRHLAAKGYPLTLVAPGNQPRRDPARAAGAQRPLRSASAVRLSTVSEGRGESRGGRGLRLVRQADASRHGR